MLLNLGPQPNNEISALITESNSFFSDGDWQRHLQNSFRAQPLYFHDPENDDGMVVQIFQRGPFRVGYLNFPIGGTIRHLEPNLEIVNLLTRYLRQYSIHRFRVRKSAFRSGSILPGDPIMEPETAVTDVEQYDGQNIAKVRRDLSRAQRFGVTVIEEASTSAQYLFKTYVDTVNRYSGEIRYTQQYFSSLVELNKGHKNLYIFTARRSEQTVGFLVLVIEADTAYYLHGGVSPEAKKYGVSDALVNHAMSISRDRGISLFNLMTSPLSQPSLVKYKEKWGGETRQHKTYDFPVNHLLSHTLKAVEKIYYKTARFRSNWLLTG